jgi:hypothetical protein
MKRTTDEHGLCQFSKYFFRAVRNRNQQLRYKFSSFIRVHQRPSVVQILSSLAAARKMLWRHPNFCGRFQCHKKPYSVISLCFAVISSAMADVEKHRAAETGKRYKKYQTLTGRVYTDVRIAKIDDGGIHLEHAHEMKAQAAYEAKVEALQKAKREQLTKETAAASNSPTHYPHYPHYPPSGHYKPAHRGSIFHFTIK